MWREARSSLVKRERLRANIDEFPPEVRVYEEPILRLVGGVSDLRKFAREDSGGERRRKSGKREKVEGNGVWFVEILKLGASGAIDVESCEDHRGSRTYRARRFPFESVLGEPIG